MAGSNSLALLPPRQTAQAPQDASHSNSTRKSNPSDDQSFHKKLESAKKHTVHTAANKQTKTTAAPVAAAKVPVAKPEDASQTTEQKPGDPKGKTPGKGSDQPQDQTTEAEQDAQKKLPDAQTLPVATEHQAEPVEKKPAKAQKSSVGKSSGLVTIERTPQGQNVVISQQNPATAAKDSSTADQANGGDAQDPVSAIAATGEFGTGKVVQASQQGGDAAENSSSDAGDSQGDSTTAATAATAAATAQGSAVAEVAALIGSPVAKATPHLQTQSDGTAPVGTGLIPPTSFGLSSTVAGKTASVAATPQAQFVEDNHPKIITGIQGQMLPNGGTMQIRLDPPELGALSVTVHMKDGVMTASFETSNDNATKMLTRSLGQLKSGLEAAGVNVDKIHVEQAPRRDSQNNSDSDSKQPAQEQQKQAQQDQQRRELVRQMWRKLAGGDPLDLVA